MAIEYVLNQSVLRAMKIMETLLDSEAPISLKELAEKLRISESTAYRILSTLAYLNYVEQEPETEKYKINVYKMLEINRSVVSRIWTVDLAAPHLRRLAELSRETAILAVIDPDKKVIRTIDEVVSPQTIRLSGRRGQSWPLYCSATGKLYLASLPDKEADEMLRRTALEQLARKTITSNNKLEKQLQIVRSQGFAVDNQECEDDVVTIMAPVRDFTSSMVGAIGIAAP